MHHSRSLLTRTILVLFLLAPHSGKAADPHYRPEVDGPIDLNGPWLFAWQQLLEPASFRTISTDTITIDQLQLWANMPRKGLDLSPQGYATYSMTLNLDQKPRILAFARPEVATAFRIYLGDELFWQIGKVASNEAASEPGLATDMREFYWPGGPLQITIQVSNFYYRNGGFVNPLRLGTSRQIRQEQDIALSYDYIAFGIMLVMGVYHLILYLLRVQARIPLWFGLYCLTLSIRTLFKGEMVGFEFFPQLEHPEFYVKISYISYYAAIPMFYRFVASFFDRFRNDKFTYALDIIFFLGIIHVMFSDLPSYQSLQLGFHTLVLITILHAISMIIRSVHARIKGSLTFLIGLIIISTATMNDALSSAGYIASVQNSTSYVILIFMVFQFFIIAERYAAAFRSVERQEQEIRQLYQQLQERDEARTRFFNNTSHELRTPLNGIIGFLDLALKGSFGPLELKLRSILQKTKLLSESLLNQVNDILELAKAHKGNSTVHYSRFHLRHGLAEVNLMAEALVERTDDASYHFEILGDEQAIANYVNDRSKLLTICRNLVSNAIKFRRPHHAHHVDFHVHLRKDGELLIEVSDNGIGIATEHQKRIFEEYEQLRRDTGEYQGTGLGLSLVKRFVEALGGSLALDSQLDHGTHITIRLPAVSNELVSSTIADEIIPDQQLAIPDLGVISEDTIPDPAETGEAKTSRTETVLIVDDNHHNIEVLELLLANAGYKIRSATNGVEALNDLQSFKPDLILLDLNMPHLSGDNLLKAIRRDDAFRGIPVIILTARASQEEMLAGLRLGANDYLAKPFSSDEVLTRVDNFLKLKRLQEDRGRRNQQIIDDKMVSLGVLSAGIAHEINNPLTIIQAATDNLEHAIKCSRGPDTYLQLTPKIHTAVQRIALIVQALRSYTGELGDEQLKSTDLEDIVEQSLALVRGYADDHQSILIWAREGRAEATVRPSQITQILLHLLKNAIDATLTSEIRQVEIRIFKSSDALEIRVSDTGPGIAPELRERIFDPFMTTKSLGKGVGLGLSIASGLAQSHGGQLTMDFDALRTTFVLRLPKLSLNKQIA